MDTKEDIWKNVTNQTDLIPHRLTDKYYRSQWGYEISLVIDILGHVTDFAPMQKYIFTIFLDSQAHMRDILKSVVPNSWMNCFVYFLSSSQFLHVC